MKKLGLFSLILFCAGLAHAGDPGGTQGTFGGMKVWKTSITASNDQVNVATIGYVRLAYPIVGNPGSANARMVYTDGQGTTITMRIILNTNDGNGNYGIAFSTSGWGYKSYGDTSAEFTMPWDYLSAPPPQGISQ